MSDEGTYKIVSNLSIEIVITNIDNVNQDTK